MQERQSFNFDKILLRKFHLLYICLKLLISHQTYNHILNLSVKKRWMIFLRHYPFMRKVIEKSFSNIENILKNVTGRPIILDIIKLELPEVNKHWIGLL